MISGDHREGPLAPNSWHVREHLLQRGAKVVYAGGVRTPQRVLLGLYGGSELPGVLH